MVTEMYADQSHRKLFTTLASLLCMRMKAVILNSDFFQIEVQLIYNVVLVSGVQQSDSVTHTYMHAHTHPLWFIMRC